MRKTLVLFDIDGTLVDCKGVAGKCFATAFRKVFGADCPKFSGREISGLTDSAILALVLGRAKLRDGSSAKYAELFALYAEELAKKFTAEPPVALAGAREAVALTGLLAGCVPGLLTGSTRATARIKLEFAGIGFEQFACGAFSEDGEQRELLPPVARSRFARVSGDEPELTVLVGDTPRDAAAAIATGCEFIGVATGHYTAEALAAAGARAVLPDLSDVDSFCRAIAGMRHDRGGTGPGEELLSR
jgi:phosphoglycolate phosphatase-like HAD superfamily hydrolase